MVIVNITWPLAFDMIIVYCVFTVGQLGIFYRRCNMIFNPETADDCTNLFY